MSVRVDVVSCIVHCLSLCVCVCMRACVYVNDSMHTQQIEDTAEGNG